MRFNENLIKLRKENGMSQEQLGFELNVTRQTVSKWELGISTPEMDKLIEISKLFGVSVDELINEGGVENMKGNYQTDNNDYYLNHSINKKKDNVNVETKVIVLTANAIEGMREQYLAEGFADYLSKPVEAMKLESMLAKYLQR